MASKPITQAEARRLQQRVRQLESAIELQRREWSRSYPGGTHLASINYGSNTEFIPNTVRVANRLGHAVVVTLDGSELRFYGIEHPRVPV